MESAFCWFPFVGTEHIKLIFEYAGWVIKENFEDGLRVSEIFI